MTPSPLDRWTRAAVAATGMRRRLVGPCWRAVARTVAAPLAVHGQGLLPDGPVVLAANHASHADTVVLLAALRDRSILPAAAADYFFSSGARGLAAVAGIGAFPFPRQGRTGLDRVEAVLASGLDVLLFPQGTRDGGPVRPGIGLLAEAGAVVVPVRLSGTSAILPKGRRWPRRHPVDVVVGAAVPAGTPAPVTTARVAAHLGLVDDTVRSAAA